MRSLLVTVIAVATACSHSAHARAPVLTHVAPPWQGPAILATVPADTPYLIGIVDPMPPEARDRLFSNTNVEVLKALKKAASGEGRGALVAAALYSELDGTDHWSDALGIPRDARFVFYGLSDFPVLRVEVKDEARVREVLARIVKAGDPDLQPRSVGRAMLYVLGDHQISYVFGVADHELIAAAVPAVSLERALPAILGTELPAKSMRDANVLPAFLAKHHYTVGPIGFVDTRRLFEAASGHGKGQYDQLASLFEGKIQPACQDDLMRIAAVLPRAYFGYSRFDARGFVGSFGVEVPRSVSDGLAKLHATMPELATKATPLLAFGVALDLDAAVAWLKQTTAALHAAPFRCESFAGANKAVDELSASLDKPLPTLARGLHGFELVIDDATVLPPSGNAHFILEGDHIADAIQQLAAKNPLLATFSLRTDGTPIDVPLAALGVPASIKSIHVALRPNRAVLAVGDDSASRASAQVGAPEAHMPLAMMAFDLPKLRDRFGMFLKSVDFDSLANTDSGTLSLDAGDEGISLEMVGTWAHGR